MTSPSEDNALAAEYALGTLDGSERSEVEARRKSDRQFHATVSDWEYRLAPLVDTIEARQPPAELWPRILSRIGQASGTSSQASNGNVILLRRQIRIWRGATVVTSALAAALALWVAKTDWPARSTANQTYVAVLQQGSAAPSFVVSVNLAQGTMTVVPSAAVETSGKSLELWMIASDKAKPLSLGLVDANAPAHPVLPAQDAALISHATYALTLEPPGGSPNGEPSSPPVYVGRILDASR